MSSRSSWNCPVTATPRTGTGLSIRKRWRVDGTHYQRTSEDWLANVDANRNEMLLDALPREPVPVIGHSFGAVIALRAAVERPGRVSSLVVIEPPFYAALKGSYMHDKTASDMASIRKKVESSSMVSAA